MTVEQQTDKHAFPTPKIVEIDWNDAWSVHNWNDRKQRISNAEANTEGICKTIGYVIDEREDRIMVTESLTKDDDVGCCMTIPRAYIVRVTTLREAVE